MSVLINMEMPKSCADCPIGDSLCCPLMPGVPALWKEYTLALRTNRRHDDCPLVPVPKHGDLIDRDALEQDAQMRLLECNKYDNQFQKPYEVMRAIALAPTIIPAEDVTQKTEGRTNETDILERTQSPLRLALRE